MIRRNSGVQYSIPVPPSSGAMNQPRLANPRDKISVYNPPISSVFIVMSPLPSLISSAAACLAIWVLWKAYQRLRLSPLDNVAGPPVASLLKGRLPF